MSRRSTKQRRAARWRRWWQANIAPRTGIGFGYTWASQGTIWPSWERWLRRRIGDPQYTSKRGTR
jgi:hypothetical protein